MSYQQPEQFKKSTQIFDKHYLSIFKPLFCIFLKSQYFKSFWSQQYYIKLSDQNKTESMNFEGFFFLAKYFWIGTTKAKLDIKIYKTNHANNCKWDVLLKH